MNLTFYTLYEHSEIIGYLFIVNRLFYWFRSHSVNKHLKHWFMQCNFSIIFIGFKWIKPTANNSKSFFIFYLKICAGCLYCQINTQSSKKLTLAHSR